MPHPREMLYPYTMGAKFRRFPFRHYWANVPFYRYLVYSYILCVPVFCWIEGKLRSPAYKKQYYAKLYKEREGAIQFCIRAHEMSSFVWHDEEKYFVDPSAGNAKRAFPRIRDASSVHLSVIIPSYNEEQRLPAMLDECLAYLEERLKKNSQLDYEVVVVDDGSVDRTTSVALEYSKKFGCDKVRVLTLRQNRGKGGAIRLGFMNARGRFLLFADADGATKFCDLEKLEKAMKALPKSPEDNHGIVVGSRAHLEQSAIAQRSFFRTVLMHGFHFLVWLFCVRSIRDTQCGFKLFTRDTARLLFPNLHVEGWAFDVELLFMAEKLRIPLEEVAVAWTEVEGSKIVPFWSWLQMGRDLLLIWFWYFIGRWTIKLEL